MTIAIDLNTRRGNREGVRGGFVLVRGGADIASNTNADDSDSAAGATAAIASGSRTIGGGGTTPCAVGYESGRSFTRTEGVRERTADRTGSADRELEDGSKLRMIRKRSGGITRC